MLVLQVMSRIGTVGTAEGASHRVATPEVMSALKRMEEPESFWDILFSYTEDRILDMVKESRGDVRFAMVEVQAHDVKVFLHQHREELESYQLLEPDEEALTHLYLDGLEEARSRAVFH